MEGMRKPERKRLQQREREKKKIEKGRVLEF